MIQSYEQMPIATYGKILRVIRNEQMNDFDKEIAMLSIISDKSEEELISIPLVDLKAITSKCGYLLEQPKPAKVKDEYEVGDYTLCPMKRIERISAGQFISFQELAKAHKGRNDVEYLPQILSCFLIPKGKKYSNDYGDFDIYDVQDAIRDHLSIVDALALLAFFFGLSKTITSQYPTLFGVETEADVDKDTSAEGVEDDATEDDQEVSGFAQKWGWTINIDRVSEITRTKWGEVEDFPVMYFLNILAYGNDKAEEHERQSRKWSR